MSTLQFNKVMGFLPTEWVERVLVEYDRNDVAHQRDHAINVVNAADDIINLYSELESHRKVILVAALLHDIKCWVNRDKHHMLGALAAKRVMAEMDGVLVHFDDEDIINIETCILEHRASWKHVRSNLISDCVASADRGNIDVNAYMRRAVRYRYSHLPAGTEITHDVKMNIVEDSLQHMREKFGIKGYAWATLPYYTKLRCEQQIEHTKEVITTNPGSLIVLGYDNFDAWTA